MEELHTLFEPGFVYPVEWGLDLQTEQERCITEELGIAKEPLWWYLDSCRWDGCPHAGFGLGFERLVMYLSGRENIRDVIPFPRTPRHCEF